MTEEYESMTVAQLKELLKEQGLPVSGKKADLIERLAGAVEEEETPVEETEAASDDEEEDDFFEEDDDWDDDEDEVHVAKQKPVLDEETQEALALRAAQKKKTPSFRRTEWFRYKRLSRSGWRAPHGMDSNVETTSTEVHLFVLDTVRLQPLVGFTQVAFKKSWFTTLTISNQSIPRHRQLESDVPLVAESVRTFTPVLMN